MPVYTVHEPPQRDDDALAHAERFVLVRDGFHFWAFLLGPVWILRHRLWLVLIGYVIVVTALGFLLRAINAPGGIMAFAGLVTALLVGFEAGSLRRWTLSRRGWSNLGVVVGEDREAAEHRFFNAWVSHAVPPAPLPPADGPVRRPMLGESDVIGLFPEPGGRP